MIRAIAAVDSEAIFLIIEKSYEEATVPIGPRWSLDQVQGETGILIEDSAIEAFILYRDVGEALEIEFLATAPEARGKARMLKLLQHMLQTKPVEKAVWLEVHEGNAPARRLYEKVGFKIVGKRPRYYSDGGAAVLYNYS